MTLVFGKPTGGSGGGASDFTSLSDTPSSYSGQGGKATRVNAGESAVEFYTPTDANDAVKVSSNDTTAGFLNGKLLGGTNVTLVEGTDGGNETLTIDASVDISGKQNILSEGAFVDGDKTKLDAIEASADVTDATNVQAAGALMDSEVTNLAQVKAFDSSDYATAAQGTAADSAVQNTGDETIAGVKTFSSSPIIPAPSTDLQAATKKYVDDNAGGGSGGITWNEVTGTTQAASVNAGYIANNAALVTITIPTTAAVGDVVRVTGKGAGGWKIAQNASEIIHFLGTDTTTGTGGSLASTGTYDGVEIVCVVANTEWVVASSMGNITIV